MTTKLFSVSSQSSYTETEVCVTSAMIGRNQMTLAIIGHLRKPGTKGNLGASSNYS